MLQPTIQRCLLVGLAAAASSAPIDAAGGFMDCMGTTLCGVLTVESGFGSGSYQHDEPAVHGLWPEVGTYGSSACVAPGDDTPPTTVFPCYKSGDEAAQLEFEQHEWGKHGVCAGVQDAADFFTQVCGLAKAPLAVMTKSRAAGKTATADFASDLKDAGYPVFGSMDDGQVLLSACADKDGTWQLAAQSDFKSVCGTGPAPTPAPPPPPGPSSGRCVPDAHGPPCSADSDCVGKEGCVRCAHSGFCTDVPIDSSQS